LLNFDDLQKKVGFAHVFSGHFELMYNADAKWSTLAASDGEWVGLLTPRIIPDQSLD